MPVLADADRLGQVVTNYLTNALKYSPADRPVTVGLDAEGKQARVWVRDEGPGVPPEEQEHIWERFHRVKGIEVQSGSGVGLGLGCIFAGPLSNNIRDRLASRVRQGRDRRFGLVCRW